MCTQASVSCAGAASTPPVTALVPVTTERKVKPVSKVVDAVSLFSPADPFRIAVAWEL
jgi:hypothetical protein